MAEVVLRAEAVRPVRSQGLVPMACIPDADEEDFDLIESDDDIEIVVPEPATAPMPSGPIPHRHAERHIGTTEITQGNIDNNHIYLRSFFDMFPLEAIGGANRASAAQREISVDWGAGNVVMTDLDDAKRFFRKRGWIRELIERGIHVCRYRHSVWLRTRPPRGSTCPRA